MSQHRLRTTSSARASGTQRFRFPPALPLGPSPSTNENVVPSPPHHVHAVHTPLTRTPTHTRRELECACVGSGVGGVPPQMHQARLGPSVREVSRTPSLTMSRTYRRPLDLLPQSGMGASNGINVTTVEMWTTCCGLCAATTSPTKCLSWTFEAVGPTWAFGGGLCHLRSATGNATKASRENKISGNMSPPPPPAATCPAEFTVQ